MSYELFKKDVEVLFTGLQKKIENLVLSETNQCSQQDKKKIVQTHGKSLISGEGLSKQKKIVIAPHLNEPTFSDNNFNKKLVKIAPSVFESLPSTYFFINEVDYLKTFYIYNPFGTLTDFLLTEIDNFYKTFSLIKHTIPSFVVEEKMGVGFYIPQYQGVVHYAFQKSVATTANPIARKPIILLGKPYHILRIVFDNFYESQYFFSQEELTAFAIDYERKKLNLLLNPDTMATISNIL